MMVRPAHRGSAAAGSDVLLRAEVWNDLDFIMPRATDTMARCRPCRPCPLARARGPGAECGYGQHDGSSPWTGDPALRAADAFGRAAAADHCDSRLRGGEPSDRGLDQLLLPGAGP